MPIRIQLGEIFTFLEHDRDNHIPSDEAQVGIRALVSDKVFLALKPVVQDHGDAFGFVFVALDGGGEFLGVEAGEPDGLAEVRTLA